MNLRRVGAASIFVVMLVVSSLGWAANAGAGVPAHAGKTIVVDLTGAAEVPGPGDPDGSGTATLVFNLGQGTICYQLEVAGIVLPATMAHIHIGDATTRGPVVQGLVAPNANGMSSGCIEVGRDFAKTIMKNPSEYYVNVHNSPYPDGALRGQLG